VEAAVRLWASESVMRHHLRFSLIDPRPFVDT
jgi:hypothetical protein